ncbi:SAM-dependent methyltransferase [Francisella persica ATCC VR-331]|uniref:Ribosomal RNA small subunit methyltransferase I n=1 Tax=Francisella persica ATCC VR-331 TaxID=1086726 RepID=A0AAC8VF26_9GAMM|nr:16S rRNA (cytidine(1402)-2'-O)-methyltransferase [Francisella persica]ALB02152.1 SAM-dependent methyltransferase [Francisella persica ATCC VR-331]ANH77412.1 SAM-dependent methyltransferase [Francisella persica ATCC VR-331]
MNNLEKATLYIVATHIGNLEDITYRALNVLSNVDIILAEDTRVTAKLLASLNIRNNQKLVSCHNFNEELRVQYVKELLDAAKTVALVSDAGTPLISDPGYRIVASLRKENYKVVPIPGVSAVITALSAAGLPSDSFIFKGFLSAKQSKRQQQIREFQQINTTVILYESVHRISYLLEDLLELMPNTNIVVAKELTKQFENFVFGSVQQIYDYFQANQDTLRGEFVVIIDCNFDRDVNNSNNLKIDVDELLKDLLDEIPLNKVVKLVTKITGAKKNLVYEKALKLKDASLS